MIFFLDLSFFVFARLAFYTDSVRVNFFGFTQPAGRDSTYRANRYRFDDGPKITQKRNKKMSQSQQAIGRFKRAQKCT